MMKKGFVKENKSKWWIMGVDNVDTCSCQVKYNNSMALSMPRATLFLLAHVLSQI